MYELAIFIDGLSFWQIILILLTALELLYSLCYNRKSLIFVVTRKYSIENKPNFIGTYPTILAIPFILFTGRERFFINQLKKLLKGLKKDTIYTTETHDTIIRQMQHQERLGKIDILEYAEVKKNNKKKKSFLFLVKIQLLNFSNLLEKKQEYRISFRKKESSTN
ncbi:hypothetical protein [Pelosinus sp. IPA-1]|uniref:hypothetical protein n=1 Tax=Pelosinus sp. IPA-1 TaxID=3029569 RepID=UPI0024361BCF|nr:hypothetical protein [Pelosinus sp. IPA-1]GMB00460.1 hypothetical protein PIPA1_32590 [Pelosinus sp. IPA-1]